MSATVIFVVNATVVVVVNVNASVNVDVNLIAFDYIPGRQRQDELIFRSAFTHEAANSFSTDMASASFF